MLTTYKSGLYPLVGIAHPFGESKSDDEYATHYLQFKSEEEREKYKKFYSDNYVINFKDLVDRYGKFVYTNSELLYQQILKSSKYKHISFFDPSVLHRSFWSIFE